MLNDLIENVNGQQTTDWLAQHLNRIKSPAKRMLLAAKASESLSSAFPIRADTTNQFDLFAPDWFQLYLHDPTVDLNYGLLGQYFQFDVKVDNPFEQSQSVQVQGLANVNSNYLQNVHRLDRQVVPIVKLINCTQLELTTLLADQMLQKIVAKQLLKVAQVNHFFYQ